MPVSSAETLLLNKIFGIALERKASDIHLIPGNYPVLRLDQKLFVMMEENILTVDIVQGLVDSFLSETEHERLKKEREVKTIYIWANRARFRATVFYQKGYLAISLRLIPRAIPSPKDLKLPAVVLDKIVAQQGLIIICGPFNSGRTTTIASLLEYINTNFSKRILTIERPIEYLLVNSKSIVNQREVGSDTTSFIQGLTDSIDDDVDVIGVSELQEAGVYELLLTVVESGKLVLAIMNTSSAIATIERFLSNIPRDRRSWAKDVLSKQLLLVVSQRLVPANVGGYTLATEILTMTAAVSSIIREENFSQMTNVLQTSRDEGMSSLDSRLAELVRGGVIAAEEARKFAFDPNSIHS